MSTPDFRAAVRRRLPAVGLDNDEIVSELAAQLEDAYDAALARGMDASAALREVEAEVLGDTRAWQQLGFHLAARRGRLARLRAFSATMAEGVDASRRLVRQGGRHLRRDRHFTAAVSLTLALCAGVGAAVFTVTHAVLLRPLPFPEPERVVLMAPQREGESSVNIRSDIPSYFDRRQRLTVFGEMAMFCWTDVVLQTPAGARRVRGDITTASLFQVIGVAPLHGRLLEERDNRPDANRKILLSHGLWQELFDGKASAVGRDLLVNGESFTVVGVMPPDFGVFRLDARFWIPAVHSTEARADSRRGSMNQYQVGRLRDGVTLEQARRELAAFDQSEAERFPALRAPRAATGFHTTVEPLHDVITREVRPTLLLLLVGAGVVLLLGLLNIATLTVVRSRRYLGEFATRRALGARWRSIASPLLAQGALIAGVGGVGAIGVAAALLAVMSQVGLHDVPRADGVGLDGATALACLVAVVLAAAVTTIAPLVVAASVPLSVAIHDAARGRATLALAGYLRRALVVGQVAAAFVLTATMGWILVSLMAVLSEHPGFTTAGLVTVRFDVPRPQYPESDARDLVRQVIAAVNRMPGVEAAGVTHLLPFGGRTAALNVHRVDQAPGDAMTAWNYVVSPGYFSAMQVPLLAGRYLDARDTTESAPVVVISRRLAERLWPGAGPIGRQLVFPPPTASQPFRVVGVVEDVRQASLTEVTRRGGATYRTYAQADERSFTLAARASTTTIDPETVSAAIRGVDARLAPYDAAVMPARVSASVAPRRLALGNAMVFAGTALLLATVGLYAVLTNVVEERRREFGIRLALGRSPRSLAIDVVAEGAVMTMLGLTVGGVALWWLRPALDPHFYGVAPWDAPILLAAALLITATAIAASLSPATRAARVDPLLALQG